MPDVRGQKSDFSDYANVNKLRPLKNASRYSGINHPDEIGTGIHTLSILRIALKVSATLHSVSLRAKC
jgi:hypothetical protein